LCWGVVAAWACSNEDDSTPIPQPWEAGAPGGGTGGGSAGQGNAGEAGQRQGGCGEHDICVFFGPAFIDCPTGQDDLLAVCDFAPLERYGSTCGGSFFEASDGVQTQRWSFDESGKLIGAFASGDVGDCEFWGEVCQAIGEPEVVCGAGGQSAGGASSGGQGGSGETGGHGGVGSGGAGQGGAQ
jgi:hypothetical protein